jgi:hypothetical protein
LCAALLVAILRHRRARDPESQGAVFSDSLAGIVTWVDVPSTRRPLLYWKASPHRDMTVMTSRQPCSRSWFSDTSFVSVTAS